MSVGADFAKRLKLLRGSESQEWLGAKIGVSRATINRWETKGAGSVTLDELEKLAQLFGKNPWEIVKPSGTKEDGIPDSLLALIRKFKEADYPVLESILSRLLAAQAELEASSDKEKLAKKA